MKTLVSCLLFLFIAITVNAKVQTQEIDYQAEGTNLKGYLAYDDASSNKRPGILVVHEWWGYNEYARSRARKLAKIGYTALALDMYGDGKVADHPKKAGELMQAALENWDVSKARFNAAMNVLKNHKTVNSLKIASIGYCFGGNVSLRMVRGGAQLTGAVAFHGALPLKPAMGKGSLKAAVLVVNGSEDAFLKAETVASFMKQMYEANADLTYLNLKGIKHSYTNPGADVLSRKFNIPNLVYDKTADDRSWQEMQRFFERIFK